jgi:ArsR family transcriptional regulator, arsenate/arsenite/antimonite-responsive transcriptional repressor
MVVDMMASMKRTDDPDVRLLGAAAEPTRLAILRQLSSDGAVCACDFTACCDVAQPTVSHHLKVLREAGWVTAERRGTLIWYSIRPEAVARFRRLAGEVSASSARPASSLGPERGPRALPVLSTPR